ncbi:proto-oncogene tyrosine-protein kinase receptor Ret-like [Branchiostoma floridae]|uniref:receptor protein-tyrosine kinase n=3 Tax=Branchiostoma floridae TaxID=7739 RepID=A0A9J7M244_BRAFL|nr:proto-oncogene tyrosine-protein kinase receptor Ret-like [Branchiostoma floridae]
MFDGSRFQADITWEHPAYCSQIKNYTCIPEASAPGPVQNIQASVTSTPHGISANLTWDRPDNRTGQITSFLVRWGQCVTVSILSWIQETTANSTVVPGNLQHYLLSDLRPNSRYGVQVLAMTPYHTENDLNINIAHVTCFETGDLQVYGTTKVTVSKMRTAILESTLPYGLPVGETIPPSADTRPLPLHIYIPASVAVTLLLLAVSYCYYRHYKFSSLTKTVDDDGGTWKKNIYIAGHHQPADSLDVVKPDPCDRWEIPFSRLTLYETLGRGAFGKVVRGVLMGSVPTHRKASSPIATEKAKSFNVTVAVKMLHELAGECQVQAFLEEIQLMKRVGYHPNVVSLLACCTAGSPICLVVEHMPQGDLLGFLRSKRSQVYAGRGDDLEEGSLTQMNLLSFARQIAVGMEFLWQKGFVHRDLAARNVLVGDEGVVKIGDFGLTRYIYTDKIYVSKRGGKLPIKWMSPEAIFDQTFTTQSDIWSFGVVLWELATLGGCPYPGIQNRDMLGLLQRGYRMEQPENCPDEMYQLMLTCWHELPEDRPSFTDIRNFLEDLMEKDTPYLDLRVDQSKDYYKAVDSDGDNSVEVAESCPSSLVAPSSNGLISIGQSSTLPSSLWSAGQGLTMVPSEMTPPKGITLPRTSKESLSIQPLSHLSLTGRQSSNV